MRLMRRGIRGGSAVAVAVLVLAACGPYYYAEQFGLSPTPQGVPEIRFAGCPPHAWSVTLSLAEESGHVLWRMRPTKKNRSDILPKGFLIGSVPEGWKEVVPLRRDLSPDVEYEIILESGEAYVVGLDFSLGDLRPGYVLDFDDNLVPTREFPLRTTCTEAT